MISTRGSSSSSIGAGSLVTVSEGRSRIRAGFPGDQRLAIELNPGREPVHLASLQVLLALREISVHEEHRHRADLGRERDRDLSILARRVLPSAHPHARVRQKAPRFVEDAQRLPGGAGPHRVPQRSLADQGPARLAVADQLDDVGPRARAAGQIDREPRAPDRRGGSAHRALVVGDHPVEIDARIDLFAAGEKVRERVDAKELDLKLGDVLDEDLERDGIAAPKRAGLRGERSMSTRSASAISAFSPSMALPASRVGIAGEQARRRQLHVEPVAAQAIGERVDPFVGEEMVEVIAHQRLVVPRGTRAPESPRPGPRGRSDRRGSAATRRAPRTAPRGQREVAKEARAIERAEAPIEIEAVLEHLRLEAVEARRQRIDEGPELVEVCAARVEIVLHIDVRRRRAPRDHRLYPGPILTQPGR